MAMVSICPRRARSPQNVAWMIVEVIARSAGSSDRFSRETHIRRADFNSTLAGSVGLSSLSAERFSLVKSKIWLVLKRP